MKNGFTLVELLAVIVILAVIALIATPIVLSIINDTKESAVIRSAEMYVGAVENKIMQENMKLGGKLNPKECIVGSEGNVTCDGTPLEIEVNGDKPDSGLITYDRGRVTGITLTFGERKVVTNSNGELVLDSNTQVCKLISGEANEIGSKYECEVKSGTKYNFYVLSKESDGTTNLIMERNICEDGTLATEDNLCLVAYNIDGDVLGVGPVTAMNYINKATSDWSNIDNLDITYDDESEHFEDFVLTGKARLPYKREANQVGCEDGHGEDGLNNELTCPLWMVEYLYDAEEDGEIGRDYQQNPLNDIWGYWTLSSTADSIIDACGVSFSGTLKPLNFVGADHLFGVRPVINVKL